MRTQAETVTAIGLAVSHVPNDQREAAQELWSSAAKALAELQEGRSGVRSAAELNRQEKRGDTAKESSAERAVRTLAEELRELLFFQTRIIVDGDNSTAADRGQGHSLIEFIPRRRLDEFVGFVTSLRSKAEEAGWDYSSQITDELTDFLKRWLRDIQTNDLGPDFDPWEAGRFIELVPTTSSSHAAFKSWRNQLEEISDAFSLATAIATAVDRSDQAANDLEQSAEAAREATGEIGSTSLAAHFSEIARDERSRAFWWTGITAIGIVATIIVGVGVLLGWFSEVDQGWSSQLVHLVLTLPVAAGTGYASTISSRHRQQAWWASTTAARLQTFPAFATPLPDSDQARLRAEFGVEVFCKPAFNTAEGQKPDSAAATAALTEALTEFLKSRGDSTA